VAAATLAVKLDAEQANGQQVRRVAVRETSEAAVAVDSARSKESPVFERALRELKRGRDRLTKLRDYSATFVRRELVEGQLRDREKMSLKIRHEPFSVYLRWLGDGQEALYVQGRNDNRLLVSPNTGLARFVGTLALPVSSPKVMSESRYPITEIGMLNLVERIIGEWKQVGAAGSQWNEDKESVNGVKTRRFTVHFGSRRVNPDYSKTVLNLSVKDGYPLRIENYGWTRSGKPGALVEYYEYRDIRPNIGLSDVAFDQENRQYSF
jgi:hypothetical protein